MASEMAWSLGSPLSPFSAANIFFFFSSLRNYLPKDFVFLSLTPSQSLSVCVVLNSRAFRFFPPKLRWTVKSSLLYVES